MRTNCFVLKMIVVNSRFLTQNVTGVQRFAIEISRRLKKMDEDIVFVSPHNIVNKDAAMELGVEIIGSHTGHLWEQVDLPIWLRKNSNPLIVNFANTAPIYYKNKIVVLHDITFIRYPKTFSWKFRTAYSLMIPMVLRTSKRVMSVSQFSLDEVSSYYGYPKGKMSVVYNAVNSMFKKTADENLGKEKYLFAVSSVKENKNFIVALKAFVEANKTIKDLKLFIAGDIKSKSFRDLDLSAYENNPNIKFLGRISDEDLIRYYSNAVAFLFPSLYEGFGIPVLEAQACGCPVISSNSSSLPEVLGDSALMCNPKSVVGFSDGIVRLLTTPALREKLIEQGRHNVARFSWAKSAETVAKVIEQISNK